MRGGGRTLGGTPCGIPLIALEFRCSGPHTANNRSNSSILALSTFAPRLALPREMGDCKVLVDQMRATTTLLAGVDSAELAGTISASQTKQLITLIRTVSSFGAVDASSCMTLVQEGRFRNEDKVELQGAIAVRLAEQPASVLQDACAKFQDYTTFHRFLTQQVWDSLEQTPVGMILHAQALGLVKPGEPTFQVMAILSLARTVGLQKLLQTSPAAKNEAVQSVKAWWKNTGLIQGKTSWRMNVLPENPERLLAIAPDLHQAAFAHQSPMSPPPVEDSVISVVKPMFWMRMTGKRKASVMGPQTQALTELAVAQAAGAPASSGGMGNGMQTQLARLSSLLDRLEPQSPATQPSLPGFRVFAEEGAHLAALTQGLESLGRRPSLLALPAPEQAASPQQSPTPVLQTRLPEAVQQPVETATAGSSGQPAAGGEKATASKGVRKSVLEAAEVIAKACAKKAATKSILKRPAAAQGGEDASGEEEPSAAEKEKEPGNAKKTSGKKKSPGDKAYNKAYENAYWPVFRKKGDVEALHGTKSAHPSQPACHPTQLRGGRAKCCIHLRSESPFEAARVAGRAAGKKARAALKK